MRSTARVRSLSLVALLGVTAGLASSAGVVSAVGMPPASTAMAAESGPATGPSRAALRKALDDLVAVGATAAVAEVRVGSRVWRGGSGTTELNGSRPVPVNARFRAGSTTKTLIATVVLQLVAEHRLSLSDRLGDVLPGVVPGGDAITVRQLLSHTSGLPDYWNALWRSLDDVVTKRTQTWTPSELITLALHDGWNPADHAYAYSNTNYLLLGMVIEKITGHSYAQEATRRVLRPLGLHDTDFPGVSPVIPGPHAHGYFPDDQHQPVDVTDYNPSFIGAAGEVITTTRDLNVFYLGLLSGRLLPHHLLAEMKNTSPTAGQYGLGLDHLNVQCGTRTVGIWGHEGNMPGYQTYAYATEDRHRQVALNFNPWKTSKNPGPAFLTTVFC